MEEAPEILTQLEGPDQNEPESTDAPSDPLPTLPTDGFPPVLFAPLGDVLVNDVTPSSAYSVNFMINATARPFRPDIVPPIVRPVTFNDDLTLGSFRPSKHVWSGEQRRDVAMRVTDASSIRDHVMKGLDLEFFLAKDIPLPDEIGESMNFTLSTPYHFRWIFGRANSNELSY